MATDLVPKLELPMSELMAVVWPGPDRPQAAAQFDSLLRERHSSEDTFILIRDGQPTVVRGVTQSLGPEGGVFKWRNRDVPLRKEATHAVVFAAGLSKPRIAPAACVLNDGSIWTGRLTGGDRENVRLAISQDRVVNIPVHRIVEIRFDSDRVAFLDAMEPSSFKMQSLGLSEWPYRRNRSAANRTLRMDGVAFERGLGVHARSVLEYEVPGGFRQFVAVIGIDDAARPLGHVVFQVTADGKTVFDSGPVTGADDPRPILVPIDGAKKIELIVGYGEQLDVGDQANWAEARIIK
jgi:hypothetical protein